MRYVFGPVPSRRLGNSLGVDLVPFKVCTFDCVYCQLGRTTHQTLERQHFARTADVLREVEDVLGTDVAVDTITLSGSGEPTLSLELGRVIRGIQQLTRIPVAVLTNGSLLTREDVRDELAAADLVVPSFDAGTQSVFERVNRPLGLTVESVARGLRRFAEGYGGRIWLEVMVVRGYNDTAEEAQAIADALRGVRLDKVQLNTVVRAPAVACARAVEAKGLDAIASVLRTLAPVEPVGRYEAPGHSAGEEGMDSRIRDALARRPCSTAELAASLGLRAALVAKHVERMERSGEIERLVVGQEVQFRARPR